MRMRAPSVEEAVGGNVKGGERERAPVCRGEVEAVEDLFLCGVHVHLRTANKALGGRRRQSAAGRGGPAVRGARTRPAARPAARKMSSLPMVYLKMVQEVMK